MPIEITQEQTRLMRLRSMRHKAAEILFDSRQHTDCSCPELCRTCLRKVRFLIDSIEREGQGIDIPENHLD